MRREPVWRQIYLALSDDIACGRYRSGDRLPSEAALAARFGVNRHTLRRALAQLRAEGAVHVRRGAGATVSAPPVRYTLGLRTRFRDNIARSGRLGHRKMLRMETLRADAEQAELLALAPGAAVHVAESIGFADNVPISHAVSVFPAARFPELARHLAEHPSVSYAFGKAGLADYARAWTRLRAGLANALQARHLRIEPGTPVLLTRSLNVDPAGQPVEYGRSCFAADRVEMAVDAGTPTPAGIG
ncbi:MAG: phosphonate metabolism transcriptional regulator PhnF [Alphaproteobacteria bacterium]|nr:MAG: phosphonate metabolism transcriptional regulator PhnF [Alphaproteobacteria bacterium]